MKHLTGMEDVIALENAIRAGLAKATGRLATEARAIMTKSWSGPGTRLAALQDIARRLGK